MTLGIHQNRRLMTISFAIVVLLLAGCTTLTDDDDSPPIVTPQARDAPEIPVSTADAQSTEQVQHIELAIESVAGPFADPTGIVAPFDQSNRLFVLERGGRIFVVDSGEVLETPFLDLRDRVTSDHLEQGLLGLAFHPRFRENGRLFLHYTDQDNVATISEFTIHTDDPNRINPESERVLLTLEQPHHSHNGGQIAFGPDGYLYIGFGDGEDPADPHQHSQNPETLFGSLLRIDVDGGDPYGVPSDNPFVDDSRARNEIWAIGLRNPWRFSFDPLTHDFYIADVGQWSVEEINVQLASSNGGENYGWPILEGDECFDADDCDTDGLTMPVSTYTIEDQPDCAIIGGYVYRGEQFPELNGIYFFGDWCSGTIRGLFSEHDEWVQHDFGRFGIMISAFGVDNDGELYVADYHGGEIYRIITRQE